MGRKKIDIENIENTNQRMVTFSKRRSGPESKAAKLRKLRANNVVCLIVFSPAGKAYTFSNSRIGVCNMVERFLEEQTKDKNKKIRMFTEVNILRNAEAKLVLGLGVTAFGGII
ncbi:MADS-box protein FLOWERING LOCUS C-like [Papaver somniferum]|uniref:MADS-box protein FLOWERING LOCUS C-like n=1 Tax=Papaver somniferum TaxID=3469 RepID=UPI000E6FD9A1|nr:MADS-box protein FLOWERING LOCUS C-like [Papaver somniferum]